jgi:hypothetical protein
MEGSLTSPDRVRSDASLDIATPKVGNERGRKTEAVGSGGLTHAV